MIYQCISKTKAFCLTYYIACQIHEKFPLVTWYQFKILSFCKTDNRLAITLKLETVQCYQPSKAPNHTVLLSIRTVALHYRGKLWSIRLNATKLGTNHKKMQFWNVSKAQWKQTGLWEMKTSPFCQSLSFTYRRCKVKRRSQLLHLQKHCCIFQDDFLLPSEVKLFKITLKILHRGSA